jgi:3-phenylpropionate/trans-cinnamate dioxygenase ferredoxin reductase component
MGAGLVIVGGSYGGMQIAVSAREHGYAEPITLVTDEPLLPYDRPPLSKGLLLGKVAPPQLTLRPQSYYDENAIALRLGTRAERIDRAARRVETAAGAIPYDRLALATGCRARPLPGLGTIDGVVSLRSLADAEALKARLPDVAAAVIIGGGFIGLEVASALATLGKEVVVVEALPRVIARALSPTVSEFLERSHAAKGVRILLGTAVEEVVTAERRIRGVRCTDGRTYPADLALVAIGALPNLELAAAAGLPCGNGIVVDEHAATADPAIVAAGDCTFHPDPLVGGMIRLESVQNATDQAKTAGAAVAGASVPYRAVPWFWSDQYEIRLQIVGYPQLSDRHALRGSVEEGKFALFHFAAGRLVAVETINSAANHMLGRRLIAARTPVTPEQIADPAVDLRSLLRGAASAAG